MRLTKATVETREKRRVRSGQTFTELLELFSCFSLSTCDNFFRKKERKKKGNISEKERRIKNEEVKINPQSRRWMLMEK